MSPTAVSSIGDEQSPMSSTCGQNAAALRAATDAAARQLLLALDRAVSLKQTSGTNKVLMVDTSADLKILV